MSTGIEAIAAERRRQIEEEGWTPEHDDTHADRQLARAAASYAVHAGLSDEGRKIIGLRWTDVWPWQLSVWKPKTPRENLVRAGALIAAEIERLDRAAAKSN